MFARAAPNGLSRTESHVCRLRLALFGPTPMTSKHALLSVLLVIVACAEPPETVSLIIDDVTVIDPLTDQVLPAHTVAIDGDRIVGIEPSVRRGSFVATDSIDGDGRFVIPGLIDTHVHLFRIELVAEPTLDLLLANGVTGFREMASDCLRTGRDGAVCAPALRDLADEVMEGQRAAPRPWALASAPVNGVNQRANLPEGVPDFLAPETEAEGRQLASWLADREIDLVKVYNSVPRDAYFGLLEAANGLGLEVSGHLPLGVSVLEASAAGHRTIEHARDLPVACGNYSDTYRPLMSRVVAGEAGAETPSNQERIRATLDAFDEARCAEVLGTLAANGTYLVPTHGTREMDFRASDAAYRADERLRYILNPIRSGWDADLDRTAQASDELVDLFGQFYELGIRLSRMAHAAGVKLMAGTDSNDTMIIPGFSLHDELARFATAGIDEMDVIRTATSTPAEYLGQTGEVGTVSVGALADLVLLGENPLDDIRNTQSIEAVVLGGRVFDSAALSEMLRRVEDAVAEGAQPGA